MVSEQYKIMLNLGNNLGFIFGYFLFTTLLFLILAALNKLPTTLTYFHLMAITIVITFLGKIIHRVLK